jgi:hypothetical protein
VNYTLNSAHAAYWSNTNRGFAFTAGTGIYDGTNVTEIAAYQNTLASGLVIFVNSDVTIAIGNSTSSLGFFLVQRTSSTAIAAYQDTTSLAGFGAVNSTALVNLPFFVGGRNDSGALAVPSSDQICMTSYGGSLTGTEETNYRARLRTYLTAVGVP